MRIMIVDDDPLVNQSLKIILEQDSTIEVVSMCGSGREAIAAYPEVRPDVVLSDIRMEDTDGLDATAEILKTDPEAKVILLTTFLDDEYINISKDNRTLYIQYNELLHSYSTSAIHDDNIPHNDKMEITLSQEEIDELFNEKSGEYKKPQFFETQIM